MCKGAQVLTASFDERVFTFRGMRRLAFCAARCLNCPEKKEEGEGLASTSLSTSKGPISGSFGITPTLAVSNLHKGDGFPRHKHPPRRLAAAPFNILTPLLLGL